MDGLHAQQADSLLQQFLIQVEIRPRAEYRYNYILPPTDTIAPDLYITQRNRVSMLYVRKKWLMKSDVQEIHVWNEDNKISKVGSINFYQLFIESKFKAINFRIGRQAVLFDNGRLFSNSPWAQQGRSHEGIRLMGTSKRISTDLLFLFTRKYDITFDATYSPVVANKYIYLLIYQLSYKPNKQFCFHTINAVDFFEDVKSKDLYTRATLGGRAEISNKRWYYTVNAYVQFGQYPAGQRLFAYYLQPEIKLTLKSSIWRLGMELLSGTSPQQSADQSGNFDVLYGVTWKFNGNLNAFTRFPKDVAGKGLVNPYFFITVPVSKKISIRSDFHLFFTQYALATVSGQKINKYLGFENDLSLKYIPIKNLEINYGFSFLKSSSSMQYLPKIQDENKLAVWSYLMVAYSFDAVDVKRYKHLRNKQ